MPASALPKELERDAARAPSDDALVLRGGSAIIGPDGAYIVPPHFDEPGILAATLDTAQLDAERMTLDVAGHYSRADVFEFGVRPGRLAVNGLHLSSSPLTCYFSS